MRINHNISALNTHRQYTTNNNSASKSLEKLSSGLRINKAADDAAGLAISEKMRSQIRGLDQAQRNAQDGISMIQTAEGALNESHSILQRMRELAVQSANDTNTAADRAELQKEVDQLAQEISRIGKTTEFNTQSLLAGNFSGVFQIGANADQNISVSIGDMRSYSLGAAGDAKTAVTSSVTDGGDLATDIAAGTYYVRETDAGSFEMIDGSGTVAATSANGGTFTSVSGDDTIDFATAGAGNVTSGKVTIDGAGAVSATASVANNGIEAGTYTYDDPNNALKDENGNVVATSSDGITFDSVDGTAGVIVFANAIVDGDQVSIGGANITDKVNANDAIATIDKAIESVSTERSKLGAYQNRLEHTINNLGTSSENLTAAESRIRDVDMAKEYMEYTKNNILTQSATAMLAQANQQTQGVLQLLQ